VPFKNPADESASMAAWHKSRKPLRRAQKKARAAKAHQENPEAVRESWRVKRASARRRQEERMESTVDVSFFELADG